MSEKQLAALLSKLKEDAGLREKVQAAGDLDTFMEMAQQAGFDVSKDDCLMYQATMQTLALSDVELEEVTGGYSNAGCQTTPMCPP